MTTVGPKRALELSTASYGRSDYQGEFKPAVVEPFRPAKLMGYTRKDSGILATIHDGDTVCLLHLHSADHPELTRLGDLDRATLQGAVAAMLREVPYAA